METLYIEEDNRKTIIDIDKNICIGNTFYYDGRIEPLTREVLDVFRILFLSNNNIELPNEGKYKVLLDNVTGYKHYYLNGIENYTMFFLNNGEELNIYRVENIGLTDNGWRKEKPTMKEKIFKVGKKIIHTTCAGLLCVSLFLTMTNINVLFANPLAFNDLGPYPVLSLVTGINDYTVDDLVNKIMASDRLETEDQLYLANRDFFEDILPYVNRYTETKYEYSKKFNNIGIEVFKKNGNARGYYRPIVAPNTLYISEDSLEEEEFNDVISHEFVHLCQNCYRYNVLSEATAEIMSWEYFQDAELTTYSEAVYLVRKMMEVIGPEPILHYIIGGNFSYIADNIKPYLTTNEYLNFLDDLVMHTKGDLLYNEKRSKEKFASLSYLLDKVYEKKYGRKVEDDPVIPHLKDSNLVRYYFNSKKIKEEGSYLTTPIPIEIEMSLEEAVKKDYITIGQLDEEGNLVRISFRTYMNSKYDTSKGIMFIGNKLVSFRTYIGEDRKIHLKIAKNIPGPKTYLPSVQEKLADLSNKTK